MTIKIDFNSLGYDEDQVDEFRYSSPPSDFKQVTSRKIEDQSRWTTTFSQVWKHIPTNTYWEACWESGSTESAEIPDGEENLTITQMEAYEETVTSYRELKEAE